MKESLLAAVGDALALLETLRKERIPPDQALALVRALAARHPDHWMNLVWEQESFGGTFHYDILVGSEGGTHALSYCADEETPWPVRGLLRVNESMVLRVNGEPVYIFQVISSLDHAWPTLHVGRHLIDMSLIDQALRASPIEVTDEELAGAMTRFRQRRRLFTVAEVERWMREHGATQARLETHLRSQVAQEKLRRRVAAGREEAYFHEHRADFERIQVARLFVPDQAEARRLHAQLRDHPGQLLSVAQGHFLAHGSGGELFMTLRRGELDPEQAEILFATAPGQIAAPVPSGEGHELVQVLGVLPARLDAATRQQITDILFEQWLADQRDRAHVEWFWGEAEAAEIPAVSL